MIIFRYLSREVLTTLLAVLIVLLLITMSGRFVKYLADAAAGELSADVLFLLMGYRLPNFLELILPLSLFLGILLAYGRMYMDSEMTVLTACGYSNTQLLGVTLGMSLLVAALVAWTGIWLSPWGAQKVEEVLLEQKSLTEFDMLAPGRFQSMSSGTRVTYTEELSRDRKKLSNVFISERRVGKEGRVQHIVLIARSGTQFIDEASGSRFLLLENGRRYDGTPGLLDFRVTRFEEYGVKIAEPVVSERRRKLEAVPSRELWGSGKRHEVAELQWRLSLPLLVPIVVMIAVPLSKVNPRQGRFFKLVPAIMLYIVYIGLLIWARDSIEKGSLGAFPGVWVVHLLFAFVGLGLLYGEEAWQRYLFRRGETALEKAKAPGGEA